MATGELEFLRQLIAFDSRSAVSNRPIAEFVADHAQRAGATVQIIAYAADQKANVLISRGPRSAPGGLLLSGHLDVVPADEPSWSSDPFTLSEGRGALAGRYVGRGVADMKGFVALALQLLCETRDDALRAPLRLLLTADEEVGSKGAQAFARQWSEPLPPSVIVGEPTNLQVVRMHKGHLRLRIRIAGKPAHSGYPHLGENAIERAGEVIAALTEVVREWRDLRQQFGEHFPDCPHPVLNLGTIRGGAAVNIVPDACELMLGVRLLPSQETAWAIGVIEAALKRLPERTRAATTLEIDNDSPPMLCPTEAEVLTRTTRRLGQASTLGVSYASDAGTLQRMGMNCILLGPGDIADAHKADESLDIAQWRAARPLFEGLIRDFCGELG